VGIGSDRDDADFPQHRFSDVIERSFNGLAVHLALGLHQFALLHIRADGKLPVRSGLALGDDVGGVLALRYDFAGDFKSVVLDARRHHADAGVGLVLVVRQQRHGLRNLHPGKIHHHRMLPAGKIHFSARIRETDHFRLRSSGGFDQCEFTHPQVPLVLNRHPVRVEFPLRPDHP